MGSRHVLTLMAAAGTVAAVAVSGCRPAQPLVLGRTPAGGPVIPVAALRTAAGMPQTIRGTMIEKCPVAGCWFRLRDKSGIIKVDTKTAGFVVTDVPLNSDVRVTGVVRADGEKTLSATGMSYQ